MATHSSILAWRISWTEEPGGLHSMNGIMLVLRGLWRRCWAKFVCSVQKKGESLGTGCTNNWFYITHAPSAWWSERRKIMSLQTCSFRRVQQETWSAPCRVSGAGCLGTGGRLTGQLASRAGSLVLAVGCCWEPQILLPVSVGFPTNLLVTLWLLPRSGHSKW